MIESLLWALMASAPAPLPKRQMTKPDEIRVGFVFQIRGIPMRIYKIEPKLEGDHCYYEYEWSGGPVGIFRRQTLRMLLDGKEVPLEVEY